MSLLTKKQTAEQLQVSCKTVDRIAKRGVLTKLKVAAGMRSVRFDEAEVKKVFKPTEKQNHE